MNAGVWLQMLGGNNTTLKELNTQKARISNSANESFKKKMDKVFDRKQSISNDVSKNNISNKVQKTNELKKSPDYDDNSLKNVEVNKEEQVLAASQIQQAAALVKDNVVIGDTLQQLQGGVGVNPLLTTVYGKPGYGLAEGFNNVEEEAKGEIKLPFQNNVDLVKAGMLKSAQAGNQKNQAEILINANQMQGENLQKNVNSQFNAASLQGLKPSDDETMLKAEDVAEENLLMKANNLDLSKVNIKVAEAPIDTKQADMAKQLADKIMYKLSEGKHEFDLELNPKNLGKVNIKMVFQNGCAELLMTTSNSKAHNLLSMHADTLRGILDTSMGTDSNVTVKHTETSDGQFDRDNFQEENNNQQNQHQHHEEKNLTEDISFSDRLRLGLVDDFEEAV